MTGYGADFEGLRVAVALLTAQVGGVKVDQADLVGGVSEARVIRTLTVIAGTMLTSSWTPATTEAFLRALGKDAARELAGGDR